MIHRLKHSILFILMCSPKIYCQQPPEHLAVEHRVIATGDGPDDWRLASPERVFFGLVVPGNHYELRERQVIEAASVESPDDLLLVPVYQKRLAIYQAIITSVQYENLSLAELWQRASSVQQRFGERHATVEDLKRVIVGESYQTPIHPIDRAFLDYLDELTAIQERFEASELAHRFREQRLPADGIQHYLGLEQRLKELTEGAQMKRPTA